jgi:CheY-like chemotaxis protein
MALILAVDDRANILEAVADVLAKEHACILASDGAEAVAAYVRNRPSLVLLDLVMPGMQGEEVAERILGFDPSARIVVFSVIEDVRRVVGLFRMGVCDFLAKPCAARLLRSVVNGNLRDKSPDALVRTPATESVRARLIGALEAGSVPVLIGPRGVGKKTAMREAMRELGADSVPVVSLLEPGVEAAQCISRIRPGARAPAGLILSGEEGKALADRPDSWKKILEDARAATPPGNAFHLGMVWDSQFWTPEADASPDSCSLIRFPGLEERPEELGLILDQFAGREGAARRAWDLRWLASFLSANPRIANMRLMRILARDDEFWSHLRGCGAR